MGEIRQRPRTQKYHIIETVLLPMLSRHESNLNSNRESSKRFSPFFGATGVGPDNVELRSNDLGMGWEMCVLPPFEEANNVRPLCLGEEMDGYEVDEFPSSLHSVCGMPDSSTEEDNIEDQQRSYHVEGKEAPVVRVQCLQNLLFEIQEDSLWKREDHNQVSAVYTMMRANLHRQGW
jgi:hypothetical protein